MNSLFKSIIPENKKGKHTDIEHSITAHDRNEALAIFKRSVKRMLNINIWHKLAGIASAHFSLTDISGKEIQRLAASGDFIKIDIHGPGPSSGDGFDWVNIETLEDNSNPNGEEESVAMRLRPSKQPGVQSSKAAHFFTKDATSTFIIYRKQNIITSFYHGRNEVLNADTEKITDNVRNFIMGGVALAGVSEMQWTALIKSFLQEDA
jgi:hypothetical protein